MHITGAITVNLLQTGQEPRSARLRRRRRLDPLENMHLGSSAIAITAAARLAGVGRVVIDFAPVPTMILNEKIDSLILAVSRSELE